MMDTGQFPAAEDQAANRYRNGTFQRSGMQRIFGKIHYLSRRLHVADGPATCNRNQDNHNDLLETVNDRSDFDALL